MYDTTDNQMFPLHALLGPTALLHEHGGDVTRVELARLAVPCNAGLVVDVLAAEVAVGFAG